MCTDPQIRYDTTLSLDMPARHRYGTSQDMILYATRTIVITRISATQIYYTGYGYTCIDTYRMSYYCYHHYTDTVVHCT